MDASATQRLKNTEVNQKRRVGVGAGNAIRRHVLAEVTGGLGGVWEEGSGAVWSEIQLIKSTSPLVAVFPVRVEDLKGTVPAFEEPAC